MDQEYIHMQDQLITHQWLFMDQFITHQEYQFMGQFINHLYMDQYFTQELLMDLFITIKN